jgi:hypothetical protein
LIPARVRKKSEILAELRRLVTDKTLTDEAFRAKAHTLLLADQPNALRSRAADVREVLSRNARRIRPILQLLTKLDLQGDGVGGNGLSWLDGIYDDGIDTFWKRTSPMPIADIVGRAARGCAAHSAARVERKGVAPVACCITRRIIELS